MRYTSAIQQSGFHRIKVLVNRGVQQAESEDVAFQIQLLAPEVTIIALPPQIQLVWVENEEGDTVLKPDFITLQISVTFPDGYPRQLKYSRLIVDGQEVIKIDQQPFEWLGGRWEVSVLPPCITFRSKWKIFLDSRGRAAPVKWRSSLPNATAVFGAVSLIL